MHVRTHAHTHTCIYIYIYIYILSHTRVCTRTYAHSHTHTFRCTHTHTLSHTNSHTFTYTTVYKGCHRGTVGNVLDCDIVVSEFELHSRYYVHFQTNTFGERINHLITHPCYGFDSKRMGLPLNNPRKLICH